MDDSKLTTAQWKAQNLMAGTNAPIEVRQELIAHFVATGSMSKCAEKFGYSVETLRRWQKLPWFGELYKECMERNKEEMAAKQRAIISKAYDEIFERMGHGDTVLHQGELRRIPVQAKHLSTIADTTLKAHNQVAGTGDEIATISLEILADKLRGITARARALEAVAFREAPFEGSGTDAR